MNVEKWQLDSDHSEIGFAVRHMVFATVKGLFKRFEGHLLLSQDLTPLSAEVKIEAASVNTNSDARDDHLRSEDFFEVDKHPHITFRSKKVESAGQNRWRVVGDITIRGVTREVVLDTERLGRQKDPFGDDRVAFVAKASLNRKDFGLVWNKVTETGGLFVSDQVDILLDVQGLNPTVQTQAA